MKLLLILGLIVSINGYGDIPEEGMHIEMTEAEEVFDEMVMTLEGNLLCDTELTVTITRSEAGVTDEFCCGQCKAGNGELQQELLFMPNGLESWFSHYNPAPNSDVTISYTFSDGTDSLTLTVRYLYTAEGVNEVQSNENKVQKTVKDGILYIEKDNKKYTIL